MYITRYRDWFCRAERSHQPRDDRTPAIIIMAGVPAHGGGQLQMRDSTDLTALTTHLAEELSSGIKTEHQARSPLVRLPVCLSRCTCGSRP